MNRPTISSETGRYGLENEALVFNCSIECTYEVYVDIKWSLPNDNIAVKVRTIAIQIKISEFSFDSNVTGKSNKYNLIVCRANT